MYPHKIILSSCLACILSACGGQINSESTEALVPIESTNQVEEFFQNQPTVVNLAKIAIARTERICLGC